MYYVTRDGFSFLAMGFTGKKAAQWKEKYIAAFNAMEKYIREQQQNNSVNISGAIFWNRSPLPRKNRPKPSRYLP
jgi:phage regulator Rha-like protein